MIKISPSILSADFANLGDAVKKLEKCGADYIHVDVMDGCLELYASIPAVLDRVKKQGFNYRTWNEIVDCALDEDESCIDIISEEARYLSTGIVNAVNIIEIEAVVLTGYIKYKPDLLLNKIHENVNKRIFNKDIYSIDILSTGIKENADVIASATLVFDSFIYT